MSVRYLTGLEWFIFNKTHNSRTVEEARWIIILFIEAVLKTLIRVNGTMKIFP
jgi:hypothetical protein